MGLLDNSYKYILLKNIDVNVDNINNNEKIKIKPIENNNRLFIN